jgi:hypothetical protein
LWFSADSDQCGGEVERSSSEELTADKQRPCGIGKETSNIAEFDESREVTDVSSESRVVHKLTESDDSSGETSQPCFV